jgi:hypothetical protein
MLVLAIGWSIVQLSVIMPIVNHVSGTTTDLTAVDGLEGNSAMLIGLLAAANTTAPPGRAARVATKVAMALAASWTPLVNANTVP